MTRLYPLERAIAYIETHLNEDIGLEEVSRETGYSYYHMTRLFSSVLGESVGHYIQRRRLYNASEKLVHSDKKIIDIAFDSGFSSPEAFSRAFKAVFGCSPSDYRKRGLNLAVQAKRELAPEDVAHIASNISRTPRIVQREATKMAGIRGVAALSDNQIPALWEAFLCRYKNSDVFTGAGYSVCETQQAAYTKDGNISFSVMVGGEVKDFDRLPKTLTRKILPAGRYAVFTHRGTFANLVKTYQYIYGTWLMTTKEELDDREDFEVYQRKITSFDDPDNEIEIYIPIK